MPVRTFNSTEAVREFIDNHLKTSEVDRAFLVNFAGSLIERTKLVGENELLSAFGLLSQTTGINSTMKIPMFAGTYGVVLADLAIQYRAGRNPAELDDLTVEKIVNQRTTL